MRGILNERKTEGPEAGHAILMEVDRFLLTSTRRRVILNPLKGE
jgi:hypothetical protein